MTQNIPIDYNVFKSIITHSMIESDFLEELYKLRLDDIPNKIYSYYDVLTLLSLIFRDDYEILFTWIYDNNYGRETRTNIIYQNKSVESISDIYQVLLKMYNKEINANDIIISPKVGDDLSQTDECFQKE